MPFQCCIDRFLKKYCNYNGLQNPILKNSSLLENGIDTNSQKMTTKVSIDYCIENAGVLLQVGQEFLIFSHWAMHFE